MRFLLGAGQLICTGVHDEPLQAACLGDTSMLQGIMVDIKMSALEIPEPGSGSPLVSNLSFSRAASSEEVPLNHTVH